MKIDIPYFKSHLQVELPDRRVKAILTPQSYGVNPLPEPQIIKNALEHPFDSPRLADLAVNKKRVLIITSDHTRPMPSLITMPLLLNEIRRNHQDSGVRILVATGFHRAPTEEELRDKFGDQIFDQEEILIHDAFDDAAMVLKGVLPSGGELKINQLVDWADLIVAEGFIEPHFFAGFSGGRKSVLPGICSKDTIMYNHNAEFIAHKKARTGVLDGNPLHTDMLFASNSVGLSYILNVALDANKKVTAAFAGHPVKAHLAGCAFVSKHASVPAAKTDLVVTSNGGYPLDQNIYQTVKSMTAAESCVNPGGIIIAVSSCVDGHGGEGFYQWFAGAESAEEVARRISAIPRAETRPDQWEAQILARVLMKCKAVIIVSRHTDPQLINNMHMRHAFSFDQALRLADEMLGYESEIVVIPDGVGVIIKE